mmetsp:Transcript_90876/g.208053  ORF Transcript_90876/g.208053 Transcript_90876/m.208053 type:complete len:129 (+) Transcript_90876:46-432(+)
MFRQQHTFLEFKDPEESTGKGRTQSVGRWIQSGHEEWVDFQPDLRAELLAAGKKRAECCSADAHSPPSGTVFLCTHRKKVCSYCRNWLTLGVAKECTGHPEDKCGKAGCCVAHHNRRVKKQTRGRRYE